MSFFATWLLFCFLTSSLMSFCVWWEMKNGTTVAEKTLTLQTFLSGLFFCICPLINILSFVFTAWFFIEHVAPNIVLIRKP